MHKSWLTGLAILTLTTTGCDLIEKPPSTTQLISQLQASIFEPLSEVFETSQELVENFPKMSQTETALSFEIKGGKEVQEAIKEITTPSPEPENGMALDGPEQIISQTELEHLEIDLNIKNQQDQTTPGNLTAITDIKLSGQIDTPMLDQMPGNTGKFEMGMQSRMTGGNIFFQITKLELLGPEITSMIQGFAPKQTWFQMDMTNIKNWTEEAPQPQDIEKIGRELLNLKNINWWETQGEVMKEGEYYVVEVQTSLAFLKPQLERQLPTLTANWTDEPASQKLKGKIYTNPDNDDFVRFDGQSYSRDDTPQAHIKLAADEDQFNLTLTDIKTSKKLVLLHEEEVLTLAFDNTGSINISLEDPIKFHGSFKDPDTQVMISFNGNVIEDQQIEINGEVEAHSVSLADFRFSSLTSPITSLEVEAPENYESFDAWMQQMFGAFFGGGLSLSVPQEAPSIAEDIEAIDLTILDEPALLLETQEIDLIDEIEATKDKPTSNTSPIPRRPVQPKPE